jgi:DNA primase
MIPIIKELHQLNKVALQYFIGQLSKNQYAQEYLYKRIPKEIADKFMLGFAPKSNGFVEYLNDHNIKTKIVKELGIANFDYENNAYPFFRNRIMVPMFHAGLLVGFSGRTLGQVEGTNPKYLNSKASMLYKKDEILFGLSHTRKHIMEEDKAFIVEGHFDVIGPYAYGAKNCVAICGTAFHAYQAKLLKRYTDKVYVMLDSDEAGKKAANRVRNVLNQYKIYAGTVCLPDGEDPDTFIKKYKNKWLANVKIVQ